MEKNSLRLIVNTTLFYFFFINLSFSEIRESRALVVPSQQATLSSELSAKIQHIHVQETERFQKGDTLIEFDCSLFEAQKKVVKTNVDSALTQLESDQQMFKMRSIGKFELQLSVLEHEKAKSELKIADLNVKRCLILAPFDGAVEEVLVNAHESIQPQVELIKITQMTDLELEMVVTSEWISWLSIGYPMRVFIDEIQKEFDATISGIGANVDPVSQTIQLKGKIEGFDETLLPGMSGRVVF